MSIVRKTVNQILEFITHTPKSNTAEKFEELMQAVSFEDDNNLKVGLAFAKTERNQIVQCNLKSDYDPNPAIHNLTNGWEELSFIIHNQSLSEDEEVKIWVCLSSNEASAIWARLGVDNAGSIHSNVANEFLKIPLKATLDNDDLVIIEDSKDGGKKKRVKAELVKSAGGSGTASNIIIGSDYPENPEEGTIFIKEKA